MIKACNLCPRHCNIDRSVKTGVCKAQDSIKIGAIVIHKGEEPPLIHGKGSGAIFFSGCPMRCAYCQNKEISQNDSGIQVEITRLASYMMQLQNLGCSNINLVSPTHYTPWIIEALRIAKNLGLTLPVMVNSGGYEEVSTLTLWYEYAQIYLLDLKYGDNQIGKHLSKVSDYWDTARKAIQHVWKNIGPIQADENGCAQRGLIVRHLLLPDMLSNPFAVLEFLAEISLQIPVSIMSQYNPLYYTGDIKELKQPVSREEYTVVLDRAMQLGFETIYAQELDSLHTYSPDFHALRPFKDHINLLTVQE